MNVIAFDTETTGLTLAPVAPLERQPYIIEFGAILYNVETGKKLSEESILINPGFDVEPVITEITGITNDQLKSAPKIDAVWPRIVSIFARADAVVAHNLPFDKTMVFNEAIRIQRRDPEAPSLVWPAIECCTVAEYTPEFGYNPKLTELYERKIGKKLAQTHRALDDVEALFEIFVHEQMGEAFAPVKRRAARGK